mgnify:CR=1 FL=1
MQQISHRLRLVGEFFSSTFYRMTRLLCFLLLAGPLVLSAQNWQPLKAGNRYHYQTPGDSLVVSLWIDSVQFVMGDSLFALNRRVVLPDPFPVELRLATQEPHFLMRDMRNEGDSLFVMRDTTIYRWYAHRPVGSSWTFAPALGLTATVEARLDTLVLGLPDSLQRLRLSNGQRIDWSQTYGIVYWPGLQPGAPARRLIGVEGVNTAGVQVPRFADFFRWQTGDQLQYRTSRRGLSGATSQTVKLVVLERLVAGDTLRYRLARLIRREVRTGPIPGPQVELIRDTVWHTLIDTRQHPTHQYSGQPFVYPGLTGNAAAALQPRAVAYVYRLPDGTWRKLLGRQGDQVATAVVVYSQWTQDSLYANQYGHINGYECFETGRGLRGYVHYPAESRQDSLLTAYRTATDSMGTFTPDSVLLHTPTTIATQRKLWVYPNPAQDRLTLRWQAAPAYPSQLIRLFDQQGRLWREALLGPAGLTWSVEGLPRGLYLLHLVGAPHGQRVWLR